MALIVRAFPLRRPVAELTAFAASLATRKIETDAFYRRLNVTFESWHLQETPSGPWVIAVARLENPAAAAVRHADSVSAFDSWFKSQVRHLTGVDPNVDPLGPPTTQVFNWFDEWRAGSNLCA